MSLRILASASPGEVRIATVADGALCDYAIWRPGGAEGVGDICRGRVTARVPAMAGAFIKLDRSESFLPDSEGGSGVTQGDVLTVRITRAAQGGKGPRVTARLPSDAVPARGPGALLELAARYPEAPVVVDDAASAARLKPVLGSRLSLARAAFDDDVSEQVDALSLPVVELRGGARLAIYPTPALVAIDVDAGRVIAERNSKVAAHFALNRTILPALARQIRLRNLSGAILVDLAGLGARRRAALGPALAAALAEDPLQPRLLGFTGLGLAEIVRPRVHPPLHELLSGPEAAGLAALRRIAVELTTPPHRLPALRASPAIVDALQSDTEALSDLARRAGRSLMLRSDPTLHTTAWLIEDSDG